MWEDPLSYGYQWEWNLIHFNNIWCVIKDALNDICVCAWREICIQDSNQVWRKAQIVPTMKRRNDWSFIWIETAMEGENCLLVYLWFSH